MLRGAVRVRAAVEQEERLIVRGQDAAYRGTLNAPYALDDKCCAHDQSACRARADERVALAVRKSLKSDCHGAFFLALEYLARLVGHGDNVGRVDDINVVERNLILRGAGKNLLLVADERYVNAEIVLCAAAALDYLEGCIVAAESINYYLHSSFSPSIYFLADSNPLCEIFSYRSCFERIRSSRGGSIPKFAPMG